MTMLNEIFGKCRIRNFVLKLLYKRATLHKFYYNIIIVTIMLNIIYFKII